jgi:hypothetical protein
MVQLFHYHISSFEVLLTVKEIYWDYWPELATVISTPPTPHQSRNCHFSMEYIEVHIA